MSDISHVAIAEELSNARSAVDNTMLLLRRQLKTMRERIDAGLNDIEANGSSANLAGLGSLHDQGSGVDSLVRKLNQQKMHMEQAIAHIKLVQRAT